EQLDHPEEIYSNPRTVFAASFVGSSNQFQSVLLSAAEGDCQAENFTLHIPPQSNFKDGERVLVLARPEEMSVEPAAEDGQENVTNKKNKIHGVNELHTFLRK